MKAELLALIKACEGKPDVVVNRELPETYPDPDKTSHNDAVWWGITLSFGEGYFPAVEVRYTGWWNVLPVGGDSTLYNRAERGVTAEEAVDLFLTDAVPSWAADNK